MPNSLVFKLNKEQKEQVIQTQNTKKAQGSKKNQRKKLQKLRKKAGEFWVSERIRDLIIQFPIQAKVKLGNFHQARYVKEQSAQKISKRSYRPVESILGLTFSTKSDIWSLGCLLFEMITGEKLFVMETDADKDLYHLSKIEEYLGTIPKHMKKSSPHFNWYFDKEYNPKWESKFTPLNQILTKRHRFLPSIAQDISEFINFLLTINPIDRPCAKECLSHKWLQEECPSSLYMSDQQYDDFCYDLELVELEISERLLDDSPVTSPDIPQQFSDTDADIEEEFSDSNSFNELWDVKV